jgi:hypothetical protein
MAIASFRAGETISAGDAVYILPTGQIRKAIATNLTQASVGGIAIDSAAEGQLVRVNIDAVYNEYSDLTIGNLQYLSAKISGQVLEYDAFISGVSDIPIDPYITIIGRAVTTSGVAVEIVPPEGFTNPRSHLILESSSISDIDAILLEDGSFIDLETASA